MFDASLIWKFKGSVPEGRFIRLPFQKCSMYRSNIHLSLVLLKSFLHSAKKCSSKVGTN